MSRLIKMTLAFTGLLGLVTVFQNCGKQNFTGASELSKVTLSSSLLVADDSDEGNVGQDTVIDIPKEDEYPGHVPGKNLGKNPAGLDDPTDDSDDSLRHFVCILNGPGSSTRLGLIDEALALVGQTPKTICMSQFSCEILVSKKFDVKFAAFRGYCKNQAADTVTLSAEDISQLLAE